MAAIPRASIIIRTRNEEARLPLVLEALFNQSENSFEVILVDSGSTDTTLDIARRWPVRIVHLPHSAFTFGRALNIGASLAKGQFLVNLSGHAVPVDNHWLENLLEPFTDKQVAAVGGAYVPWEDADPFDKRAAGKCQPGAIPSAIPPRRSGYFGNDNAAIRHSVWQQLPFEEAAGGGEDFLWLQQLLARGWKAVQQPAAIVRHSHLELPVEIFDRYLRGAHSLEKVMPSALRHRVWVLAADALPGAVFDYHYCNRTGQAEWRKYAIKRRLARAGGRLLGARRWLVEAVMSLEGALAKPTLRLTQLAGFSDRPLHPKHLFSSLDHLWILPWVKSGQSALDVGAGSGVHSLAIAAQGVHVLALDYNPQGLSAACKTAQTRGLEGLLATGVANAEEPWPVPAETCDLVLLLDSIEHLKDDRFALAEAVRALKPEGLLFITFPNRDTHWKLARRRLGLFAYQDPDHKHEYSLAQVSKLLDEAGLALVSEPVTITADLPGNGLISLLSALWPRLFLSWGGFRKRFAQRFPQETTGWRLVARIKKKSA